MHIFFVTHWEAVFVSFLSTLESFVFYRRHPLGSSTISNVLHGIFFYNIDVPTFKIEIVRTVILDTTKILLLKDPQLFGDCICPRLQVERENGERAVMAPLQS